MKKILFLITISIGFLCNVQAQISRKTGFQIKFADQSAKSFFERHPDFDRIVVKYENDKAVALNLFYQQREGKSLYELFDLTFEGDKYLLNKNYKGLPLPKPGKLAMEYLAGIKKLADSTAYYDLTITLYRDSTIHNFQFYLSREKKLYRPIGNPNRARLMMGVPVLQKKLEQNFKKWKPLTVSDSVLIITGIVERDSSLRNLELKSGRSSQFSKKVLEFIGQAAVVWDPAWVDTRTVRSQVKFFVRLNSDESITLSVL